MLLLSACSPAAGEDAGPRFPDFELKTVGGETRTLSDFQARVTLVNFFFPT